MSNGPEINRVTVIYKIGDAAQYPDLATAMLAIWDRGNESAECIITPEGRLEVKEIYR